MVVLGIPPRHLYDRAAVDELLHQDDGAVQSAAVAPTQIEDHSRHRWMRLDETVDRGGCSLTLGDGLDLYDAHVAVHVELEGHRSHALAGRLDGEGLPVVALQRDFHHAADRTPQPVGHLLHRQPRHGAPIDGQQQVVHMNACVFGRRVG